MRHKYAIYTIQSNNYGNRLQNYALQTVLRRFGADVFTLNTVSDREKINNYIVAYPKAKKYRNLIPCLLQAKKIMRRLIIRDRATNFERFNRHIVYSNKEYISTDEFKVKLNRYDAIIAGSDQIWNTDFSFVSINSFLDFPHPRKISYAASFGKEFVENDDNIVRCIKDFKAISVREEAGKEIIWKLAKRSAEVNIDPTLLLSQDEWSKLSKRPKKMINGKYVLTYFLSEPCKEAIDKTNSLCKQFEVLSLLNSDDSICATAGPAEFLYLFEHAEIVLTDSFHACVFSFLFNKPFVVFDRNNKGASMNSRIETLLKTFNLERKYISAGLDNDIWEHDYSISYKTLEIEREKSIAFLRDALGE